MLDALAGWLGLTVFVLAGLLALVLEVRDQHRSPAGTGGPLTDGQRPVRPWLGWLLVALVIGALALTGVRFAVHLG